MIGDADEMIYRTPQRYSPYENEPVFYPEDLNEMRAYFKYV